MQARLDGPEQRGDGAAARAAERAQPVAIDLRAGFEIVKAAHSVPEKVFGDGFAKQNRLQAGFAVLACGRAGKRIRGIVRVGILQPLALAKGVIGKDCEAVARECGRDDEVGRLTPGRVAGAHQDGGQSVGGRRRIRQVEQRGDVEARLRVEKDLLHTDARQQRFTEDDRVERRAFRQWADEPQHGRADLALAGLGF